MQTLDQLFATAEADILKAPMAVTANPLSRAVEDFNLFGGHSDRGVMSGIAEQYAHVISAAYSAISLVSKRAADQPAFVGKLTNNPSKGRSLKDHVAKGRITVPQHLKSINPENVEVIEDHPLVAAINEPNEIRCRYNMMFQTFWSIQATGRANWMAMQKDGRFNFYYLPAQWCTPIHTGQKFFDHWKVQPPGSTKEPIKVPGELMSYFHLPDPADPFGVIAPMQRMSRTIIADQEIEKSQEVVFRNGMMPIYAVTTGDGMSETFPGGGGNNMPELETHQRQQIWSMIQRQYTGAIKHGLPIILDALLRDVKRISETPDKMAFQEAGEMTEGRVYKGFGVNPISAGQVEGANRASSAVADHHLVSNSINPMLTLASQVITKRTAPLFAGENERLVFWFQPAVADDPEQEQEQWQWATDNGAVTYNEIRSRINLPPIDGGDVLPSKPTATPMPEDIPDDDEEEADDKAFRDRYIKTATQMWLKQHQREENEYSKAIQGYLAEIRKSVVAKFREAFKGHKSSASDLTELIFPAHEWDQKLLDTTRPHIQRALLAGAAGERTLILSRVKKLSNGMVAYRQKGWRKDVEGDIEDFQVDIPPETLVEINGILGETMEQPYWQAINKTVQNRILKTISDGLIEGMSNIEIANLLDLALEGVEGSSSLAIARTEITNALNGGIHAVQQDLAKDGLVSGSEWLTVGDGDVRGSDPQDSHDHVSANHQKVKAGEDFTVSGESAPWPGHHTLSAGNRINCFLPGTSVEGRFDAAMRSDYDGAVTEIVLRSGRRLTLTPNHPVLTENGFISAGSLQRGDNLVIDNLTLNNSVGVSTSGNHVDHEPVKIEQVFESLALWGAGFGCVEVLSTKVDDFHGDGRFVKGDVHVVRADSALLRALESARSDEFRKLGFSFEDFVTTLCLNSGGSLATLSRRMSTARSGIPSGAALSFDGGTVMLDGLPFNELGFTLSPHPNIVISKNGRDYRTVCAEEFSEAIDGLTGNVHRDNRLGVKVLFSSGSTLKSAGLATIPQRYSRSHQAFLDCRIANAEFLGNLIDRRSSRVAFDDVVDVQVKWYRGHVYDLSSETGLIISNGVYTSNCRCTHVSLFEGTVPEGALPEAEY